MLKFTHLLSSLLFFSFLCFQMSAQKQVTSTSSIGLEIQQYPTGFLPGIYANIGLKNHHSIHLRVGYNIVRHRDLGVHQLEEGGGFGFTLGYQYYFKADHKGFFLGGRSDLWFNSVDWKDEIGTTNEVMGNTKIVVLQPTAIVGYAFFINEKIVIAPNLALGAEINIVERGEVVGQGAIGLWGLQLGFLL